MMPQTTVYTVAGRIKAMYLDNHCYSGVRFGAAGELVLQVAVQYQL